jgi:hypothetical protein
MPSQITVSADFTNANGKFACFICGHTHKQIVAKMDAHSNQLVYINDASHCYRESTGYWTSAWSFFPRNKDGVNQDLITVLCIDTDNQVLNFVRVGADRTMFGELYDFVSINY